MFPNGARFAVSLTYDVEMCTNFPYWTCVWDHLKGAVDAETQRYVGQLAQVAEAAGARCQWFALGSSLEAEDVAYLRDLVAAGHPVGNHTYRHVNVKARAWDQLQVTYRNDPSLADGFSAPLDAIRAEVRATSARMEDRLGAAPQGFRTPGGFQTALHDAPEVQELLQQEGFAYASAHYEYLASREPRPTWEQLVEAQRWSIRKLQSYRYPNGLREMPMMGLSDIWAFRVLDLEREEWIRLLEAGVDVAAEEGLIFSILMHPQVLACRDPHAATARRIIERTLERGGWIATNDELADCLERSEPCLTA